MCIKKQELEPDMEQLTGSKLRKQYDKTTYCHLAYLTYLQNAGLDASQVGIKITGENVNSLRYAEDTTLMAKSEEGLKNFLMRVKQENEKLA